MQVVDCINESMRIGWVGLGVRSRNTRSTRLRSWCSSVPAGDLKPAFADEPQVLRKVSNVVTKFDVAGISGFGAQDEIRHGVAAAVSGLPASRSCACAAFPQFTRTDLLRDADVVVFAETPACARQC